MDLLPEQTQSTALYRRYSFLLKVAAWTVLPLVVHGLFIFFLGRPLEYLLPACWMLGGLQIGFAKKNELPFHDGRMLRRGLGLLMIAAAVWLVRPVSARSGIAWQSYSDQAIQEATQRGQPVLIDFYASWCPPCREMERRVFTNREVMTAAKDFLCLKADVSDQESVQTQELAQKYQVHALPTVVFIGRSGTENLSLRLRGYEEAKRFVSRLKAVP